MKILNRNKRSSILLSLLLLFSFLFVGGTFSYITDINEKNDAFYIEYLDINLNDIDNMNNVMPNQIIQKELKATKGLLFRGNSYLFIEIKIPKINGYIYDDNGIYIGDKGFLFDYQVNPGWELLKREDYYDVENNKEYETRVYAYVNDDNTLKIVKNTDTEINALFNSIKIANFEDINRAIDGNKDYKIYAKSYGIEPKIIKDDGTILENKEEIFNIVKRQSETTPENYLNSYDFYK